MLDNIHQINSKHTHAQQVKDSMSKHNKNYRKNELKIRRRLTCFDPLFKDEGYAGSIETPIENMASSDRLCLRR